MGLCSGKNYSTCLDESILNIALVKGLCLSRMLLCVSVYYPIEDSNNTVYYDVCVHS